MSKCLRQWPRAIAFSNLIEEPNLITFNALMSVCQRAKLWQEAMSFFQQISDSNLQPDVISYSTLLSSFSAWQNAFNLLKEMLERRLEANVITYNAAMNCCGTSSAWEQAVALLYSLPSPNVISFDTAITACEGRWQQAMCLFGEMSFFQLSPDLIGFNAVITSCAQHWQMALSFFEAIPTARLSPDIITYGAIINAFAKGHQWLHALSLFEGMPMKPDNAIVGAVIASCEWRQALSLLAEDICRDAMTYNAAMSSCERHSEWQALLCLFDPLLKETLQPDVFSFSTAISCCGKAQHWQRALILFDSLKVIARPNEVSFLAPSSFNDDEERSCI